MAEFAAAGSDLRALVSTAEGINSMTEVDLEQTDEQILACEVSDEALEVAAGNSAGMQGGSSLWSTVHVSGCTCVGF